MAQQEVDNEHLDRSPLHLLHRVGQCAEDLFQIEMAGLDLTPRQFAVLQVVSEHEGLSQTDLVERTGIDRSTVADLVWRMIRKGMLQRRRSKEDARAYCVRLTDQGRSALKAAQPVAKRIDAKLLSALRDLRADEFVSNLRTIVGTLDSSRSAQPLRQKTRKAP